MNIVGTEPTEEVQILGNGLGSDRYPHNQDEPDQQPPKAPGDRRSSVWRRYRVSMLMGLVGLLLGCAGYLIIPSQSEPATPAYTAIVVKTNTKLYSISFWVIQASQAKETIRVVADIGSTAPAHRRERNRREPYASLSVALPHGVTFLDCRVDCRNAQFVPVAWGDHIFVHGVAEADFTIRSSHLTWDNDDASATAVLPSVEYDGPGNPYLFVYYPIQHAASYDWNSLPYAFANKKLIAWGEPIINGHVSQAVATGINHQSESAIGNYIFLAGALVGAAAAALVCALQDGLQEHYEHIGAGSSQQSRRRWIRRGARRRTRDIPEGDAGIESRPDPAGLPGADQGAGG